MTSSLKARQQQRAREDLVGAALDVIAVGGVEHASIERILVEAGTSRATLYAHFPGGRDQLLREAYERAGRDMLAFAHTAAEGVTGWRERILAYSRAMIAYSSNAHLGHFYSVSGPHLMGFRAERGVGSHGHFEAIRSALQSATADGHLASWLDTDALATLLTSSLRDAGIEASQHPEYSERFVDTLGVLLDGLPSA